MREWADAEEGERGEESRKDEPETQKNIPDAITPCGRSFVVPTEHQSWTEISKREILLVLSPTTPPNWLLLELGRPFEEGRGAEGSAWLGCRCPQPG